MDIGSVGFPAWRRWLLVAVIVSMIPPQAITGAESPELASIDGLAWMAGAWISAGDPRTDEWWTPPGGGTLIGMARTIRGGKTVSFEYLRMETRADGIYYVAHPKARSGTDFRLTRLEGKSVVFENPAHDFPKRITYRLEPDGTLVARVEGDAASPEPPEEVRYRPAGEGRR